MTNNDKRILKKKVRKSTQKHFRIKNDTFNKNSRKKKKKKRTVYHS